MTSGLATATLVRIGELTNRTLVLPILVFFPTSRCNSRCVSCDWWKSSGADDLSLAEIASLAESLPALGVRLAASTTRLTRASMLDEVRRDYVDTARALGLPEWKVIFKYTLRNALIPTVTIAGLQFAGLLGGTVVIEAIFSWPGIGLTLLDAINSRDYPMIQATVLVLAVVYVLVNLLVDVTYRLLNPRIRLA